MQFEAHERLSEACIRDTEDRIRSLFLLRTPYFTGLSIKIAQITQTGTPCNQAPISGTLALALKLLLVPT